MDNFGSYVIIMFDKLPIEIIFEIMSHSYLIDQLHIRTVSKWFYRALYIRNFHEYNYLMFDANCPYCIHRIKCLERSGLNKYFTMRNCGLFSCGVLYVNEKSKGYFTFDFLNNLITSGVIRKTFCL